jgi:hypothetical protein
LPPISGYGGIEPPARGRRRHAHHALERPERNLDRVRELRDLPFEIELDDLGIRSRHRVGHAAGPGPAGVDAVRRARDDIKHADLQHVAGRRALDVDRAGHHVTTDAGRLHLPADREDVLHDLEFDRDAVVLEELRRILVRPAAAAADGVDADDFAGLDPQHRRRVGGEVAGHHVRGHRAEVMVNLERSSPEAARE